MGVNGIYGLSGSGLDIESMVKVGMMGKQSEYDKMAQKYTKNEWIKSSLLEVYSNINTFNMSTLSQYKMSANMNAKAATSTNSAISVSSNASAIPNLTHSVEVEKLASKAYLVGTTEITRKNTSAASSSVLLSDVIFKGAMTQGYNDSNGNVTYNVTYGAGSTFSANFKATDAAIKFTLGDGTSTKEISYTYEDLYNGATLNDFVKKINNAGLNVKATYDSVNDRFSFYNKEGGEANNITFTLDALDTETTTTTDDEGNTTTTTRTKTNYSDYGGEGETVDGVRSMTLGDGDADNIATLNTRDFLNNLNLQQSVNGELASSAFTVSVASTAKSTSISGTDGSLKIDGASYTTTDNKVTSNGITYDFSTAEEGDKSNVTVTQDVDGIVDRVKSFIEDYNKLLGSLYELYDEKPESGYSPLTQTQKNAMTEEQVKKWEEKAKKGILYHDSTLGKIISDLRSALSSEVKGISDSNRTSIFSLGISTTGIKGQLTLDETKLRNALDEEPDSVYNVFATLDKDDEYSKNGVAQKLGDLLNTSLKTIRNRAGSTADITEDSDLNNLLRNLQTKMSNFKKMMDAFEDKLYKKYDTMEATLAKLGTQLNYIMGGSTS